MYVGPQNPRRRRHGVLSLLETMTVQAAGAGKAVRLLSAIIGLVVVVALNSAYAQVSAANPSWALSGSRSYEESFPGLGTSQTYRSSDGFVTVYSYGRKRSDWLAGINDPQFAKEFSDALAEVRQAEAGGQYSNLVVGPTRDVTIGGQQFRTAVFGFTLKGQPSDSAVYLTAKDGQLLKYRITARANSQPAIAQLAEQFIAGDLPSRSLQPVRQAGSPQPVVVGPKDQISPRLAKNTTRTLKTGSLVCDTESPATFVARHDEILAQPGTEALRSLSSNVEKMQRALQNPDPSWGPLVKPTMEATVSLFKDVVDNCGVSEAAIQVLVIEVMPKRVAKVSLPVRGKTVTKFVAEQSVQ